MLSSFGAQHVDMASSSEDAIEKCKFNYYDIILCDFNLGQGKNGQQILEALRASKRIKHIHLFIMITAETAKDVVLGTREYHPDAYIAKPITRTVLEQRLGHLIKQQAILKPINNEIDLENHSKAITLCHQQLDEKTKYQTWCYQTLGKLYLLVGDTKNALSVYSNVLSSRQIPWASLGKGQALQQSDNIHEAIESYEEAIKQNVNMIEAYDGLSECHIKLGQHQKAQNVLQEAVELSPRMVLRQETLGDICHKNQDIQSATNAFRQTIKHGEHSVYEKADNYLNLGRCLSEWNEGDDSPESKERASEAIRVLDTLTHKFSNDEDACINATLIEARVHVGQKSTEAAKEKLHQAECIIEDENLSSGVGLEFAKTLYSMGQPDRAESLLIELAKRYEGENEIISRIESLMDEPESLIARKQAKELNKNGIKLFEQGELEAAVKAFESALSFTPKHAALNLNIVQVLTKLYKETKNSDFLASAQISIDRIKHIPEQHNQFKRMNHLNKIVHKLTTTD